MPAITGLTIANTRAANTAFVTTFFPRFMSSKWARICGTTKSSAPVEPFALEGAAPPLKRFNGTMNSQSSASFAMNVPNPVFKNFESIKRAQFEFDQTRSLAARSGQIGVRVAQGPDFLLANRFLKGSTAGSQNYVFPDDGKTYVMTFDGQPMFSASHNNGDGTSQSNILQGHLPNTKAAITGQDMTVTANEMQLDLVTLVDAIAGVTDDKGVQIFTDFDPEKQVIVVVPPILGPAARLAFKTQGTLGGTNGSSSGSTTNIGTSLVKDVIEWNLLAGCIDIESDVPGAKVSPVNPTDYYFLIDGDFVRPFYYQRFVPVGPGQTFPLGEDPAAQAQRVLERANTLGLKVSPEAADVYAATEIMSNLGAIGANAQESVAAREEFFISGRTRFNVFPGPWFTGYRMKPVGGS